jgi:anti-sigma regulatory factor (Ser/Thr protein kinase)
MLCHAPRSKAGSAMSHSPHPGHTDLDPLLTRSFTADREAPGRARLALRGLSGRLDHETSEDVRLLVSELVTNSLRHTGTSGIRLEVWASDAMVRVEVADDGVGFELPSNPRPGQVSGWGLFMVDRLTDRWGVDTAGETLVWFEFDRPGAGGRGRREFFQA